MDHEPAVVIRGLDKTYDNGFQALKQIDIEIRSGEIFALLGPNGAGKTTLINAICGLINITAGRIEVFSHDIVRDYRYTRSRIGLVPQELTNDPFETVWNAVQFSRGLFGKPPDPDFLQDLLNRLSLWEKRHSEMRTLSGGMKRRVMIAKALSHEPDILFLDEPTAGVDVELRRSMWNQVRELRETGVTIILTTHYINEAEEMADRVGVINQGELILVEDKPALMKQLGKKELVLDLYEPLSSIPSQLSEFDLTLGTGNKHLVFTYNIRSGENGVTDLLDRLREAGIRYKDLSTRQSSLEDIFVGLVDGP